MGQDRTPILLGTTNLCCTVASFSTDEQMQIKMLPFYPDFRQLLWPEPVQGGLWRLRFAYSDKVLDVRSGLAPGSMIVQHPWHGGNNQLFTIRPYSQPDVPGRRYTIHPYNITDLVLQADTIEGFFVSVQNWGAGPFDPTGYRIWSWRLSLPEFLTN